MPELPEIETVKLQLLRVIKGAKVQSCKILSQKTVQGDINLIVGKFVVDVRRKAKVLLIDFSKNITTAFHFKMTGQLVYIPHPSPLLISGEGSRIVGGHPTADFVNKMPSSHTRIIFNFDKGTLYFNDQRLFGWVKVGKRHEIEKEKFLQKLGPEPFDISTEEFVKRVSNSKRPIKLIIMDQEVISGMGNIYANDSLWEARINPKTPSNQVTNNQLTALYNAVIKVLKEGIKYGGATAADAKYINLHGLGGHYQEHFRVYDRVGLPCLRCKTKIKKFVLSGRGTYYCPVCQV